MDDLGPREHHEILNLAVDRPPEGVFSEVGAVMRSVDSGFPLTPLRRVFDDVVHLYRGEYPGYRACNTPYHDLEHTLQTFLTLARLMHGCAVGDGCSAGYGAYLGLISALMHDTGYVQEAGDTEGTGAKHSKTHIARSIEFMSRYMERHGFSRADISFCRHCILCTNITSDPADIPFATKEEAMVAKMLGIADLLGQMADRNYPEKLLLLYREFVEGDVEGFESERDLFSKTVGFYGYVKTRFANELGGMDRYMINHFRDRWDIDRDLYPEAIERNIEYIGRVAEKSGDDLYEALRRDHLGQRYRDGGA